MSCGCGSILMTLHSAPMTRKQPNDGRPEVFRRRAAQEIHKYLPIWYLVHVLRTPSFSGLWNPGPAVGASEPHVTILFAPGSPRSRPPACACAYAYDLVLYDFHLQLSPASPLHSLFFASLDLGNRWWLVVRFLHLILLTSKVLLEGPY